jgi:hypothetical protein
MTGKQWMGKIYEEIDRQVDSDILAFTEEELAKALPASRFLRHILATGKVIYEKKIEKWKPGAGSGEAKWNSMTRLSSKIPASFTWRSSFVV